ncbi:hypothetical protein [Mucilaginibacter pallidiroseus]|uniref:hypothetical protein n=1 Tax=Mucilaginibacter pallidiroseus TaxID=2599295 RepID=UPI0011B6C68C|nr:hypothetical protein [Mucilaginibacter pallidiroseus]
MAFSHWQDFDILKIKPRESNGALLLIYRFDKSPAFWVLNASPAINLLNLIFKLDASGTPLDNSTFITSVPFNFNKDPNR